jgi:hypothetical protein
LKTYLDDCGAKYKKDAFTGSNKGTEIKAEDISNLKTPTSADEPAYATYLNIEN